MTLSEIEIILDELIVRHHNLDVKLLSTLLLASGWEDKNIKEAVSLFKQKKKSEDGQKVGTNLSSNVQDSSAVLVDMATPVSDEITFYQPDGTEEKELHVSQEKVVVSRDPITKNFASQAAKVIERVAQDLPKNETVFVESKKEEERPEIKAQQKNDTTLTTTQKRYEPVEELTGERKDLTDEHEKLIDDASHKDKEINMPIESDFTSIEDKTSPLPKKEKESLVVPDESIVSGRSLTREEDIPGNLPLLPFESSPHVWSFDRYKHMFHGEDSNVLTTKEAVVTAPAPNETTASIPLVQKNLKEVDDISLEKTPLTKEDESLVFLAGVMLLVIILILGYMYSNGRL
jgi:hypothetical protein